MPHKKAKKSTRDSLRAQRERESDLAPGPSTPKDTAQDEDIPKSAARILNAERVRKEFNERKRKEREGEGKQDSREESASKMLKIKPGEHIRHFNQRVEDDMRAGIRDATLKIRQSERTSSKKDRWKAKAKAAQEEEEEGDARFGRGGDSKKESKQDNGKDRERDFAKSTPVNRVTNIVEAPPELTSLPRLPKDGSGSSSSGNKKAKAIVSLAQKARMEEEREKAIQRYREMREGQRAGVSA